MGISLPVGSHLDESQARRTANQAEDYFSTAGRQAGDAFSRYVNQGLGRVDTSKSRAQAALLERAYDKAADAAGKLRVEEAKLEAVQASESATNAQLISHSERAERARRAEARAVREAADALRDYHNAGRSSSGFMDDMGRSMGSLGTAARSFAVAGAPAAILAVGSAAVTAAGALAVLPAAIGGVAAGIGTLVVGMHGFGDAVKDMGDPKKFAEDLQKLSPSAQQAALEIKHLIDGPLGALRKATQEALFSGMAKELHDVANVLLPSVKTAMTGIASAFNAMGKGALDQLMKPDTVAAFNSTLTNVTTAFHNLAPAAAPFTKAMTDIMQVGSSFLPGLATSVTNAATAFSQFITHARDSGQLANWIREGGDMLKQIASLAWDVGKAFAALMPVAKEIFPYVSGALHEVSSLLHEHPGLIWGVVGAFAAWKTIEGVSALITSLGTIKAALLGLPAVAGTSAAGISAALSKIALPAWLAWMIGKEHDKDPTQAKANDAVRNNDINGFLADFQGGSGTFLPPGPGPDTRTPQQIAEQNRQRRMGLPGGQPMPAPAPGWDSLLPQTAGLNPWAPGAIPGVPDDSKGKKQPLPTVPYGNQDPMSLLQGFPATASLYGAAGTVLDNQQKVAQAKSDLNTLEKANVRDEDAITAKRNELARAQREEHESELRLTEAKQQAVQKSLKGMQTASGELQQLGVQLDKDFGISKGLGGIVENAVKALGNILAAPFLQALGFVAKANPNEGSGLVGIMAANGAFGQQYTPGAIAMMQASQRSGGGGYPGMGSVAGIPAMAGESGRDFAHRAMMPFWQSQGFEVGDHAADKYGEHQNGALDIMVPSIAAGQQVLQQVLRDPNVYGAIFNNQTYGYGQGASPRDYTAGHTGDPNQDHTNHVHAFYKPGGKDNIVPGAADATGSLNSLASAANSAASALGGPAGGWNADWLSTAQKESSGNWAANTGNGHSGGLQFSPPSWAAAGGTQYAPEAWQATPYQQAMTAENLLAMQGPGAWPNTFTPGSAGPAAPGAGPMYPGIGPSQALPGMSPLGPVTPAVGGGTAYPSQGGNSGNIVGGLAMDGIMAATSGLDMLAPGTSAAAKIGIQVANRTIGYAAQNAGIAANAIGEFFSVGDNPKGSIGAGWFGKIAGGLAGAGAALPNIAGQKAPQQQGNGQQQGGNTNNVNNTINVQAREGASGQEHGEQVAAETSRMYAPAGRQ